MTTTNSNRPVTDKQQDLVIKRTFNLPVNTVWKAWSDEESIKKWWGPTDYTCPHASIDFRVGGKCLSSMKGPDGNEIWSTGTYKEINPKKKIVVTDSFSDKNGKIINASEVGMSGDWPEELLITVELKELGDKTEMILTHQDLPEEMQDDCRKGWEESFDKLEKNVK